VIDAAKLEMPAARRGIAPRTRLLSRIHDAVDARVVTVLGPPGSGKTNLLAQVGRAEPGGVAWIVADDGDNDPVQLLRCVTHAIERLGPLDDPVAEALYSPDATALQVIPRLTNALRRQQRTVTLIVDNAHLLINPHALDVVALLADRLPHGSRVLAGAREEPGLPLARWRAAGALLEVNSADLALDGLEAAVVTQELGLELTTERIEELVAATEGWAVGVYLSALSMRTGNTDREPPPNRSDDAYLSAYLHETLLTQLDDSDLEFMTRTAVLDRLMGPLCDAVAGTKGSVRRLEALARHNLLIVPINPVLGVYRYHALLRDVLLQRLERVHAGSVGRLHGVAARWLEAHDDIAGAVRHAMEGNDLATSRRLIATHALATYRAGGRETVARWFDFLGDERISAHPALTVLACWLAIMRGSADDAERWAAVVEAHDATDRREGDGVEAGRALVRAALCRHGPAQMLVDADRAVALEPSSSPWHPVALVLASIARMLNGQSDRAQLLYHQLDEVDSAAGHGAQNMARAELALEAIERRQWNEADELVRRHRLGVTAAGVEQDPTSFLGLIAEARLAVRRGMPAHARELVTRAQVARPRLTRALPHWSVRCLTELARVQLLLADLGGASASLAQAEEVLTSRPELGPLVETTRALRAQAIHGAAQSTSGVLTPAELRLLPYLATYLSFKEIAIRLGVSHNTVKTETMGLYAKLDVTTRADAVECAVELGLLEPVHLPAPVMRPESGPHVRDRVA
jgi:LuxR family maltose regulon positive regulatory protein